MAPPSKEVLQIMFEALDHGVASVLAGNGPLIPFAMLQRADGKRTLMRFTTGANPAEAAEHARREVAQSRDCVVYAVAETEPSTSRAPSSPS